MAKPFWKKSHKAWYVKHGGKLVRLGKDEATAQETFKRLVSGWDECPFSELAAKFLKQHTVPSTHTFYKRPLNSFCDHIKGLPVRDIKVFHVTEWIDTFDDPSDTYIHNLMRAVKTCLQWAKDQGHIAANPIDGLKIPAATSRSDEAYLLPEQCERLLAAVDDELWDIVAFLHATGCRPKEARQIESRHLKGQCAILPRKEAKGKKESRVIHLSDTAYAIVRRLALKHPSGSLFRRVGTAWTAQALAEEFEKLSKTLGFHVTSYSLRHSWATEAIIRGLDLQTIAVLMGHSDLKMLSRVYSHVQKRGDHLQAALKKAVG